MKKKILSTMLVLCISTMLFGCGQKQEPGVIESQELLPSQSVEASGGAADEPLNKMEEESVKENEETVSDDVTFETLSKRRFDFSSGAGGWYEEFTIEKDGYFTGKFRDYDLGATGDAYPDGTVYSCSYTGHFDEITKVGDYVYEMKLKDITYKVESGEERLFDGMLEVYTGSYIFGANDTFTIYAPGMPVSELNEELYLWVKGYNREEDHLIMSVLADTENNYAASSVERPAPYEDAQMTYNTYKESLDYYADKLANEAQTTMDMVLYSGRKYELSDECLNYLWNLIRYNVPSEKYAVILEEQRTWIAAKEAKEGEILEEYGGGTFAPVDVNDTLAQMTMERCEELMEYLK